MAPHLSLAASSDSSSIRLASPLGLASVLGFSVTFYLVYSLIFAVYQIYFSPLRQIPGPKSWIAFPILRHISAIRGRLDIDCRRFFNQYNTDAIRISPNEVFFNSAPAWQEIYGHGRTPQMPKPMRRIPSEPHNIINANDIDHTRFRKALAHAFSERALREQESLLQDYTTLLIDRLSELAADGKEANMTAYCKCSWNSISPVRHSTLRATGTSFGSLPYRLWSPARRLCLHLCFHEYKAPVADQT